MNYQLELQNILHKIYEYKIYNILLKENIESLKGKNLEDIENLIKSEEVYLGNDLDDYIINLIPKDFEGYLFRKLICQAHNLTYPILYDEDGQPLKDHNFNKFSKVLWIGHTNNCLIRDIYNIFTEDDFHKYVSINLSKIYDNIISDIKNHKDKNRIIIPFTNKSDLKKTFKKMIINGKLDFYYALLVVDMDNLRNHMIKLAIDFSYYDEFDKLEDNLEECLDKFFKYNNDELLDLLINNENFELINNVGLIKKI